MYIPYNSRLEYHKSIFGAVKTDQTVTFRIILPRDFCCHAAKLVIKKAEADEYSYVNMQWDCMEGVGEEWWKVDFTAEKAAQAGFTTHETDLPQLKATVRTGRSRFTIRIFTLPNGSGEE